MNDRAATVAAAAILSDVIVSGSIVEPSCSAASDASGVATSAVDAVRPTIEESALRRETFAMADSTLWCRRCASPLLVHCRMQILTYVYKNLDGDFGRLPIPAAGRRSVRKFILMERSDALAVVIGPDFDDVDAYYHAALKKLFVENFGIWDVRGGGWVDVLASGSADGPDVPTAVFYGASTAFGRFDDRLNDDAVLGRVAQELYLDRAEVKAW